MDRIAAIRRSLAIFIYGIMSLVPVLGVIPAVCAIGQWWVVRSRYKDRWNPASQYLRAGVILALLGISSAFLLFLVLAIWISNNYRFD
jgi:hypothetical protein